MPAGSFLTQSKKPEKKPFLRAKPSVEIAALFLPFFFGFGAKGSFFFVLQQEQVSTNKSIPPVLKR
jgi:hypothetical protein